MNGRELLAELAPFQQSSVLWGLPQVSHLRVLPGLAIISPCLLPLVSFHFSTFCFDIANLIAVDAVDAVEAVPFFVFWVVFSAGLVSGCVWAGSILVKGTKVTSSGAPRPLSLISVSRWSTMSLYGLSSRYALLSNFLTWSGVLAYMALLMNCCSSDPEASLAIFGGRPKIRGVFALRGRI